MKNFKYVLKSLLISVLGSSSTTNRSLLIKICQRIRTKLKYWFKFSDQSCDHVDYINLFKQINYRSYLINIFLLFNNRSKFNRLMYSTLDPPRAHSPVEPHKIDHKATL